MASSHQRLVADALLKAERKLKAIKKIAYSKRGLGSEMINDIRKILEAEG